MAKSTLSNGQSASTFRAALNTMFGDLYAGAVDVATFATAGAGTSGSPWTGWDTAITWAGATRYRFKKGHYSFSTALAFSDPTYDGMQWVGEGPQASVLHFTGTTGAGVGAVTWDSAAVDSNGVMLNNLLLADIGFHGTANCDIGFFFRAVHRSTIERVSVADVFNVGLVIQAGIGLTITDYHCSKYEQPSFTFTVQPKVGLVLDSLFANASQSTVCRVITPIIEGVSEQGIVITGGSLNCIAGGTSEFNLRGVEIAAGSNWNVIDGLDCEGNSDRDLWIKGDWNEVRGGQHLSLMQIAGDHTRVNGGTFAGITIDSGALDTILTGIGYNFWSGAFTDNGTDTLIYDSWNDATSSRHSDHPYTKTVTVGAGGVASISFDLPNYKAGLRIKGIARSEDSSDAVLLFLRFNDDATAANYDAQNLAVHGITVDAAAGTGLAGGYAGGVNGATNTANYGSGIDIRIPTYRSGFYKQYFSNTVGKNSGPVVEEVNAGVWKSVSAITKVTLIQSAGDFAEGTVITLTAE